jgi:hypothetical protein
MTIAEYLPAFWDTPPIAGLSSLLQAERREKSA